MIDNISMQQSEKSFCDSLKNSEIETLRAYLARSVF